MKDYIERRAMEIAEYIISTQSTVRQTAKKFGVSKSTVHKDVTERLPKLNPPAANEVKKVLLKNKSERHIRGGKATRLKYKEAQSQEKVQQLLNIAGQKGVIDNIEHKKVQQSAGVKSSKKSERKKATK